VLAARASSLAIPLPHCDDSVFGFHDDVWFAVSDVNHLLGDDIGPRLQANERILIVFEWRTDFREAEGANNGMRGFLSSSDAILTTPSQAGEVRVPAELLLN